ncbi:WD repeat-containing protein 31 [Biomphalaria pfeifferi]|uniref:WD repeat-containing protein 31 n=1 Tax=Biomphalaria pfeifferi TaxID=112525 RepID=A0AAD8FHQ2_BIOPF|nr:WD repeat-containing protein 31 [Biomphalaria pfeifferi]
MIKQICVLLYDYNSKKVINRWQGHTGPVTKVCYGSSCKGVFSSSRDKTIKLWEIGNPNFKHDFVGHSLVVTAIHLNKDNSLLCSGSRDNSVKLWDVESATCIKTNSIAQNLVTDLKFIPESSLIVQTGEDKQVRAFDVRSLQPVYTLPSKQYIQMCCDVSSDGNYVVSSSNGFSGKGCEVTIWDIRCRKLVKELFGHQEAVEACLFLPGSNAGHVISASRDCTVKLWNVHTGVQETQCCFSGSGPLTSLAAYQDGSVLVGSFNQGIHLLTLKDQNLVQVMYF